MTEPDADDLRQLFRDAPSLRSPETSDAHALIAGELDPQDALALSASVLDDPDAALEVRVAAAMEAARAEAASSTSSPAFDLATHRARRTRVVVTALVAVAAAAVVFLAVSTASRPPPLEDVNDGAVRAGVDKRIRPAPEMTALPRSAFELRWQGGPAGATYDLFITTATLDPVYQALDLPEAKHRVPSEALAKLPAGTALLWRVVAVTEQGRRMHSTAFEVTVE